MLCLGYLLYNIYYVQYSIPLLRAVEIKRMRGHNHRLLSTFSETLYPSRLTKTYFSTQIEIFDLLHSFFKSLSHFK